MEDRFGPKQEAAEEEEAESKSKVLLEESILLKKPFEKNSEVGE